MTNGTIHGGLSAQCDLGAHDFFTPTLLDRTSRLLVERIDGLREGMRAMRADRPFTLDIVVILPDHLRCIWTLPSGDADHALRWREIKSRFFALAWRNGRIPRFIDLCARAFIQRIGSGVKAIWKEVLVYEVGAANGTRISRNTFDPGHARSRADSDGTPGPPRLRGASRTPLRSPVLVARRR